MINQFLHNIIPSPPDYGKMFEKNFMTNISVMLLELGRKLTAGTPTNNESLDQMIIPFHFGVIFQDLAFMAFSGEYSVTT